jgi:hypothetical protein
VDQALILAAAKLVASMAAKDKLLGFDVVVASVWGFLAPLVSAYPCPNLYDPQMPTQQRMISASVV